MPRSNFFGGGEGKKFILFYLMILIGVGQKMRIMRGLRVILLVAFAAVLMVQFNPLVGASPGLSAPSLISPSDNALVNVTPTFTWSSVPGADNYELQYAGDDSFPSASTICIHNIRVNSVEAGVLDGINYWRVRAGRDNGDISPWSSVRVFTLDTILPREIELISPENGVYLDNAMVRLDWTDAIEAENYTVLVDDNENFTLPAENKVVSASVYVTPALSDGKYYWKVIARDLAGNENQTPARTFTVDTQPPETPILSTPSDRSHINDDTPTLDWENVRDAIGLARCEVWVDGSLEKLMENQATENIESFVTTHELSDGFHSWRVAVTDHVGHESTSPTWGFTVDTVPPSTPHKSGPQDCTITPVNVVTFSWSAATDNLTGVAHYEVWVDNDPNFEKPVIYLENLALTSKSMTLSDDNYSWRVRAWDNAGNSSEFENSWTLLVDTTAPSAPSLLWPAENVLENTSTPRFRWVTVDDPSGETYEVQVAMEKYFWNVVYDKANIAESEHEIENTLPDRWSDNLEVGPFYYWRVRAKDNLGHVGEWSDNLPFMVFLRDFAVSVSPSSGRIAQGGSTSAYVTISKTGNYENSVDLSISAPPSGISYIFDRMGSPPLTASLVINSSGATSPGSYTLTIIGTDPNGWERTATYSLEVFVPPTATIQEIPAGEQRTVEIGAANITQVVIGAQSRIQNATIDVDVLDQKPAGAPALGGQVYSYIDIGTENIGSGDIGSLEIQFYVERSWIQLNNLDASKVRLNRYSAGGWQELATEKIDEDAVRIYYSAQSPGFSTFAITGEEVPPPGWFTDWRVWTAVGVLVAIAVLVVWKKRVRPKEGWKEEAAEEKGPPGEKPPEKEGKPPKKEEDVWW